MLRYVLLIVECVIALQFTFIYLDMKKIILPSHAIESYSVTCVDNINYVVFNNRVASVKYDIDGEIETCDLGEE